MHLTLGAWRAGLLDPTGLGEVSGRKVDEAGLQRAFYRSSMGEIEHVICPLVKGKRVFGRGPPRRHGTHHNRETGGGIEELRLEDLKRYMDMTPAIFVFVAIAMAVRHVSLSIDDQDLYILAGILFALMYGQGPPSICRGPETSKGKQGRVT